MFLRDLVVVLTAAVVVVAVLRRMGVPSIAGFILTGVLAGPSAFGLVHDVHKVELLAEVGVVLLLYSIGLELSLSQLKRLWKAIVVGGALQVGLSIIVTVIIALLFGLAMGTAIFLGCVVAVSSTAIVLRGLSDRGELDAPHGRFALGILVFQDLCVVPMILAIPLLADGDITGRQIWETAWKAMAVLFGILVASRYLVPPLLGFVATTRQRDLFVLTVFLICFGTAWVASLAGISLALGAFLAGLIVAGSEFRHQALTDLIPAREILASLFFVSVGMLLDVQHVATSIGPILGILGLILVGKFIVIFVVALAMRLPTRVGILTATTLCQVGEFSFVLLRTAQDSSLVAGPLGQNILVAIILSMLITPLAIAFGPHLASSAARVPWLNRQLGIETAGETAAGFIYHNHVIVVGYGLAGELLATALEQQNIPIVIVDINPENVSLAKDKGHHAVLTDITHTEALQELGVSRAKGVVFAINDSDAVERAIRATRRLTDKVTIIARTQYEDDIGRLMALGATEVVSAESQAANALVEKLGVLATDANRNT